MKKLFALLLVFTVLSAASVTVLAAEAGGTWSVTDIADGKDGMWLNAGDAASVTETAARFENKNCEAFSYEANFTEGSWVIELSLFVEESSNSAAEIGNFYTKAPDGDNTYNDYFVTTRNLLYADLEETGDLTYKVQLDVPSGATIEKLAFWSCGQDTVWELKGVKVYKGTVEEGEELIYGISDDNSGDNNNDTPAEDVGSGENNDGDTDSNKDDDKDTPVKTGDVSAILAILATGAGIFGSLKLKRK